VKQKAVRFAGDNAGVVVAAFDDVCLSHVIPLAASGASNCQEGFGSRKARKALATSRGSGRAADHGFAS
jgi:hypothetical protein